MKFALLIYIFLMSCFSSFAQFIASANGNWNVGTTWGGACTTGCSEGIDYPGASDDVYTNGFQVTVPGNGFSCNNLRIQFNTVGSLNLGNRTLTVNGVLSGWDGDDSGFEEFPTVDIVTGNEIPGRARITLTGNSLADGDFVIDFWDAIATIGNLNFSFGVKSLEIIDAISAVGDVRVLSGTLTLSSSLSIGSTGDLSISSGATLITQGAIDGGSTSSLFANLDIDGTLNLQSTNSYVNATTMLFASTGVLNVSFAGANQTEGWWHTSNGPTFFTGIDPGSTIVFNSSSNQTIPAQDLGNLTLSGAGTKSLQSSGTLKVLGNLFINSANVTFDTGSNPNPIDIRGNIDNDGNWNPTQNVIFNGTSSQTITGNNVITFNGGINIANTSSSVSLVNVGIDVNGLFDIDVSSTFDPDDQNVNLAGNLENDGTLLAGNVGSTFTFDGTTTLTGSGSDSFNNVVVGASSSLTASNANIDVIGNFTNNGTFDASTGSLTFNGSSTQTISSNSTTEFYDLQFDNSVNNQGTTRLGNILTLGTGVTFDADGPAGTGTFVISSTGASSSAIIAEIPAGSSVTGNVTFERYIPAFPPDRFRNFAIPLNGITASELDEPGDVRLNSELDGFPNVFTYLEIATGDVDQGWLVGLNSSSAISAGVGYTVYRDVDTEVTIDATGTLNQGNVSFGVSYTESSPANPTGDGWNFLGNPYPAPIDYDLLTRSSTVGAVVYVWDAEAGQYITYDASSGLGALTGGVIAPGQSFWVQTSGNSPSPSLSATEASKVTSTTASFFRTKSTVEMLKITLQDSLSQDVTYLKFDENATEGFDIQYDGRKLQNSIFNLSTLMDGQDMVYNTIPKSGCSIRTEMNITNIRTGDYNLRFDSFNSIEGVSRIALEDKFLGEEIAIDDTRSSYDFTVSTDSASYGNRFVVVVEFIPSIPEIQIGDDNLLSINSPSDSIQWFFNDEPIEGANNTTYPASEPGTYTVSVSYGNCRVSSGQVSLVVTSVEEELAEGLLVVPNPFNDRIKINTNYEDAGVASINIYNANGILVFSRKNFDLRETIDLSSLKMGFYMMRVSLGEKNLIKRLIKE